MARSFCLPFLLVSACFNPVTEGTTGEPATSDPATEPGPTTGQSVDTSTGSSGSSTETPPQGTTDATTAETGATDSGTETSETTSAPPACDLMLDVVFLVSRGEGMLAHQEKLRAATPGFFGTLQGTANLDLRLMVSDLDRVFGAETCQDEICPQSGDDSCAPLDPSYPCNQQATDCENLYGASVFHPHGIGAANKDCGFGPFLTELDSAALACALTLGEGTDSVALGGTLSGILGSTDTPCNGSFIRDGAYLVLIVVSNGDDSTFTEPPQWIAETLQKRPADSIMIAALTSATPKISEFVDGFPLTATSDIAADSFDGAMLDAASLILEQCK